MLAIALGANLATPSDLPVKTLIKVRPKVEEVICNWIKIYLKEDVVQDRLTLTSIFRWSPLFQTEPMGGPSNQPEYINAVLIVDGTRLSSLKPCEAAAIDLLERFLNLEKAFGRDRQQSSIPWGPRTLDIDLLAWGGLQVQNKQLTLPHPRLIERSFVVVPLGEALSSKSTYPRKIPSQKGWPE